MLDSIRANSEPRHIPDIVLEWQPLPVRRCARDDRILLGVVWTKYVGAQGRAIVHRYRYGPIYSNALTESVANEEGVSMKWIHTN
jgi:hypothetical protein